MIRKYIGKKVYSVDGNMLDSEAKLELTENLELSFVSTDIRDLKKNHQYYYAFPSVNPPPRFTSYFHTYGMYSGGLQTACG